MQAASIFSVPNTLSNADLQGFQCRLTQPSELQTRKGMVVLRYMHEGKLKCRLSHYHFSLENGQYLLANPGQSFLLMNRPEQAAILEVQIPVELLSRRAKALGYADLYLFKDRKGRLSFCEGSYLADEDTLGRVLNETASRLSSPGQTVVYAELATTVIDSLLESQKKIFDRINRLTSAKLSTKKELYRRLIQAQEYIHENLHTNLDLDTLSQVACLSKFHFIRLFKEVFEQTPRQYLISCRLERASKMLLNSSKSFHEICLDVGLKDSSSFGRLFKKNFGATPHIYRRIYAQAG